jgi:hypothetical protein
LRRREKTLMAPKPRPIRRIVEAESGTEVVPLQTLV